MNRQTSWALAAFLFLLGSDPGVHVVAAPPEGGRQSIDLTPEHEKAVNRRRRTVVQYDVLEERRVRLEPAQWLDYVFTYVDEKGTRIDSIFWDMGSGHRSVYPSKFLELSPDLQEALARLAGKLT